MTFGDLKLGQPLLRAVEACGFDQPTGIQEKAIPFVLEGRDLMASAQTGTGKTAAFVLPILERLAKKPIAAGHGPRCLVLTPTRELAMQVCDDVKRFSRFTRSVLGTVIGGVSYGPQERILSRPLDILVATPGRLLDHMGSRRVDFRRLEVLVLDEADRMLDMGFIDPVREIVAATPSARQTLLFSATLAGRVLRLAEEMLQRPARVELAAMKDRHALIEQRIHGADDAAHKRRLLDHHLQCKSVTQAVVFTATKRKADKLAKALASDGHRTAALHGDMRQGKRRITVENLRRGEVRVLVATDVAARGLDIKGMSHVFNFDLPNVAEDYIHRIGRTGRAGANGIAISLVGPEDWSKLADIERLTGRRFERETIPGLEPVQGEPAPAAQRAQGGSGKRRPQGGKRWAGPSGGGARAGARRRGAPRRSFGARVMGASH
jgi:superfamily II DNA/RNA helicase